MLKIDHMTVAYKNVPTVMDFSMNIKPGQIIALVGESGSGKTTVIRAVMGLLSAAGKVTGGDIVFDGKSLLNYTPEQWRTLRGSQISMIFQDSGGGTHDGGQGRTDIMGDGAEQIGPHLFLFSLQAQPLLALDLGGQGRGDGRDHQQCQEGDGVARNGEIEG